MKACPEEELGILGKLPGGEEGRSAVRKQYKLSSGLFLSPYHHCFTNPRLTSSNSAPAFLSSISRFPSYH